MQGPSGLLTQFKARLAYSETPSQTNKQKQMKESGPWRKRVGAGEGIFFFPERCLSIACGWVPQKVQHVIQVQKLNAWNIHEQ